jgi:transcriptional regulator with XRE-family HTH domain
MVVDSRKVFGRNLRRARESRAFSQDSLAAECGLHRTYVGSVERGERNVGLLNIVRLARALGCSAAFLMEGVE